MNATPATTVPTCRFASAEAQSGPICPCTGVMEATVRRVVDEGIATTVVEVTMATGAGSGCRACHCRLQRVLDGLPAKCGGRFDWCGQCGCINAICRCDAA